MTCLPSFIPPQVRDEQHRHNAHTHAHTHLTCSLECLGVESYSGEVAKEVGSERMRNLLSLMGATKPRTQRGFSSLLSKLSVKKEQEKDIKIQRNLPVRSSLSSRSTCSGSDDAMAPLVSEWI